MSNVKLFYAGHCGPCHQVVENIQANRITVDGAEGPVELVDLENETNFDKIAQHNIETIPIAIREDGKVCRIAVNEENKSILISCDDDENQREEAVYTPETSGVIPPQ